MLITKIKRLTHSFLYRVRTSFPVLLPFLLTTGILSVVAVGVFVMERGSFASCTYELVDCLENGAQKGNALSKGASVLSCAVRTLVCDVETIWFYMTDDKPKDETLLSVPLPSETTDEESLLTEKVYENHENPIFDEQFVYENKEIEEKEETAEDLKKEMERLRREREFFEQKQNEMRLFFSEKLKKN